MPDRGGAAAVYADEQLVEMFNTGTCIRPWPSNSTAQLPPEVRDLPSLEFKGLKDHSWMRARMKRCTLGILYGLTPHRLALKAAGNHLDKLYRAHAAWLVVPLHDAFVFEAPGAC